MQVRIEQKLKDFIETRGYSIPGRQVLFSLTRDTKRCPICGEDALECSSYNRSASCEVYELSCPNCFGPFILEKDYNWKELWLRAT